MVLSLSRRALVLVVGLLVRGCTAQAVLDGATATLNEARAAGRQQIIGNSQSSYWNAIPQTTQQLAVPAGTLLSFRYSNNHDVYLMSSFAAWQNCDMTGGQQVGSRNLGGGSGSSAANLYEAVATGIGTLYIVCSVSDHCLLGQKIQVQVGITPSPPPPQSPSPPPPSPLPPSPLPPPSLSVVSSSSSPSPPTVSDDAGDGGDDSVSDDDDSEPAPDDSAITQDLSDEASSSDGGLSTGVIVGIILAALAAVSAVGAIVVWASCRKVPSRGNGGKQTQDFTSVADPQFGDMNAMRQADGGGVALSADNKI